MARAPRSAGKIFFEEMKSILNEKYNNGYFFEGFAECFHLEGRDLSWSQNLLLDIVWKFRT